MNLSRHQKSPRFLSLKKHFIVIIWTALLSFGALSFCFGQTTIGFLDEMTAAGITSSEKKNKSFYTKLRELELKYQTHLDSNCEDKAALYRNFGAYYYLNKDKKTALKYFQDTALQVALHCPDISGKLITQLYLNILNSKSILDQTQELPPIIEKLKFHLRTDHAGPILHQAKIQGHISRYYDEIGDRDQAILWIKNSIANYNKLPLSEKKLSAYLELGYILHNAEEFEQAIAVFDTTKLLAKELNAHDNERFNEDIIYNKAVCYEDMGDYAKALEYTETYASMTDETDIIIQSDIANLKAHVAYKRHAYDIATEQMKKSIQLSLDSEDEYQISGLAQDYLFLSDVFLAMNEPKLAASAAMSAIDKNTIKSIDSDQLDVDFSDLLIKDANNFNRAAHQLFKSQIKFISHEKVFAFADQLDINFFNLLSAFDGDESTFEITKRHHDFCDILLDFIFSQGLEKRYTALTSYYIATSKSLALLEKISTDERIPEHLKTTYDSLRDRRHAIFSELEIQESLNHSKRVDSLVKLYFDLNLAQDKFNAQLESQSHISDFRKLRTNLVEQTQASLLENEVVVDLFYGKKSIYGCRIEKGDIQFFSAAIHNILNQDFISLFSSTHAENLQRYDDVIDSVSVFFEPLFYNGDASIDKITIIPDGKLLYFPFEALEFDSKQLIEHASIQYLFSNSLHEKERDHATKAKSNYAGFAMSYNDEILKDISRSQRLISIYNDTVMLGRLPDAVEEVKSAHSIFDGKKYIEDACTRASFFKHAGQSRILHIANHALLQEENSNLSAIVFTKENKPDLINAVDIKKLNLDTELTILSSCNSGLGELIEGNGLRSLGLSFVEAGCPAIIVNLWEASDKSTKHIITSFAKYVKEGMTKSSALRAAKLDYLSDVPRELQHPKYWAHMVLIGNDEALEFSNAAVSGWRLFGLIGGLLLFVILIVFYWRSRRV